MSLIIENQNIDNNFIFNKIILKRLLEIINEYTNNIYYDIIKFYSNNKDEKNKYLLKIKYDEIFYYHIDNLTHQLSKLDNIYFLKIYQYIFNNTHYKNVKEYKLFFNYLNEIIKNLLHFCFIHNKFKKNEYFYILTENFYESFNYLYKNKIDFIIINQYFKIFIKIFE